MAQPRTDMTATEKLELIHAALAAGGTVYIQSYTRVTRVTPRSLQRFAELDRPLFRVRGESLYMSAGRGYVCIDYCGIATDGCEVLSPIVGQR